MVLPWLTTVRVSCVEAFFAVPSVMPIPPELIRPDFFFDSLRCDSDVSATLSMMMSLPARSAVFPVETTLLAATEMSLLACTTVVSPLNVAP